MVDAAGAGCVLPGVERSSAVIHGQEVLVGMEKSVGAKGMDKGDRVLGDQDEVVVRESAFVY